MLKSMCGFSVWLETILKAKILTGKKEFRAKLDESKNFLIIEATEQPEKGRVNKEIVKELQKKFKAEVIIVSGLKSRKKTIKIKLPKEQILQILETLD